MEDSNSIHARAYFNLLKTESWIDEKIKDALKPFDLTHAQLNALHILFENDPEPVSANELKTRILVRNPDLTRLLDRLVKKGYVKRETCPENRRKIDISLTKSGKEFFNKAHVSAKVALGNFFEKQITKKEAEELRRILHKIRG
ncbi:MAG: MarR family transcriptional regulator [Bacteroidetes bacterium]|nr:MAG: MarR family transcriptional regulator [Bacteroidota bacterium]